MSDPLPSSITILAQRFWPDAHGGVETHLWQFALHLAQAGVRVEVRTENRGGNPDEESPHPLLRIRRRTPPNCGPLWRWLPLVQMNDWRAWLRRVPSRGLVWASNPCLGTAAILAGLRKKMIYNPAACAAGMRRVARRHPHATTLNSPRSIEWMDRFAHRFASSMVVSSNNLREQFTREYGERARVDVIPLGAAPSDRLPDRTAARARWKLGGDSFVAGFVGRLDPCKGVEFLFDAWAMAKLPADARILIAGEGPDEARLRGYAYRAGLGGRIVWAGRMTDPADAYAAMDVMVLPSIYEAFGLVAVEAMAAGVPVIGRRNDGDTVLTASEEIIDHGQTGLLVDSHDPRDLAAKLFELHASPALRRGLGQAARRAAAERTWTRYVNHVLARHPLPAAQPAPVRSQAA